RFAEVTARWRGSGNRCYPLTDPWHIVSMTEWGEDYFNEEVQALIEFDANGTGHFQSGYVQGYMDWRPTTRDGEPFVEWSWEGGDGADGTPLTSRGWVKPEDHELHGMISPTKVTSPASWRSGRIRCSAPRGSNRGTRGGEAETRQGCGLREGP